MLFRTITAKIGNMRKPAQWTICPVANAQPEEIYIQSDKRIARVNLAIKKVVLSNGKGGHNGFAHLAKVMGAVELNCPAEIIEQFSNLS